MRRATYAVIGPVLLLAACSSASTQGSGAPPASSAPAAPSASPAASASPAEATGSAAPAPFFSGCKRSEFDTDEWDQFTILNDGSVPVTLTLDPATLVGFDEEVPPRFDSTIEPGAGSAMFQVRVPVNTDPDQPYPYNPQAVSEGDYLVSSTISWAMEVAAGDAAAGYLGVALTCTSEFDRTDPENWTFLGWTPSVSVEARSEAAPLVWGTEWTGTCDEPVTLTADDGTAVTVQGTCDGTQLTLG
jgi:hypothetical protein